MTVETAGVPVALNSFQKLIEFHEPGKAVIMRRGRTVKDQLSKKTIISMGEWFTLEDCFKWPN